MCKSMNDYIEKAETAVLSGTGIIEEEDNEEPDLKSITDPLKGSQPKNQPTALEELIKSLKKSK